MNLSQKHWALKHLKRKNFVTISFDDIQLKSHELGFDDVGITHAHIPKEDIDAYIDWIRSGYHSDLSYMEKSIRCFPEMILPHAKTAIIFVSNYKQDKDKSMDLKGAIASYAHGKDYHNIHRKRLKKFILWLEEKSGLRGIAKGFSDSTPVLEKALAVQAGLGWFGKNTLLIHRKFGTFTLLSGVFTTLEIPFIPRTYGNRLPRCGNCTRCLDACPTQAFVAPYQLDAAKCLSYHLIESKKEIPDAIQKQNPGYIFGCDICQDVCPHNVKSPLSTREEFSHTSGIGKRIDKYKLEDLEKKPEMLFGTPLQRRGILGLKHTASTLLDFSWDP